MFSQSLAGFWHFRQSGQDAWLPATVPGGVHTDLMAAGRIPDPFVGDNEVRVAWVAESDWEYRRSVTVDPDVQSQERVLLVCDGLDTLATVFLNGVEVGKTDNMFRRYRWDVKHLLHTGANELVIHFASPVQYVTEQQAQRPLITVSQGIAGAPYLRKAPCQFGWDWGPQLPPIGIWRDIRLEGRSAAEFADVHLRQHHSAEEVTVTVDVQASRWEDVALAATVTVTTPTGMTLTRTTPLAGETAHLRLPIDAPQLWWPNGYGSQPLYQVTVTLHPVDQPGAVVDRRDFQVGLRTIELRQEEDEFGRSFTFYVNGVPIFAKGSNWIPADSFPTRLTEARLDALLRACIAANHNMLRVWGGGFYEDERFYDLCDRYGILVWQDFIFSCAIYPLTTPAFVDNVHAEVIDNVRRLRHRASLALWCGNNEMEEGWVYWDGWNAPANQDLKAAFEQFFFHTLAGWVEELDAERAYWPSSPSSGTAFEDPRGSARGDAHYWEVWHGFKPFTAYRIQYPRFMSEFGFQSLPTLPTIRTFAEEADWNMTSYIMERHQKNNRGNTLMVAQMLDNFRLPKDFPALVYMTMVLQAEGITYGVEHWRRNRHRVSGTVYWQTNDCWPVASWSSLDYFGRWKALHYAARRFYAPVLLSVEDDADRMGVYLTSDRTEAWQGRVRWSLETLSGVRLDGGEQTVVAAPLATTPVWQFDFAAQLSDDQRRDTVFVAEVEHDGHHIAQRVATFVPNKHVGYTNPHLTTTLQALDEHRVTITVAARSLARYVELAFAGAEGDVVFSDNYFDVRANHPVTVACTLPDGWSAADARAALRVQSLYDAFSVA
jgi:beta-mannosidase